MKHDIHRKYLVTDAWRGERTRGVRCRQGYLSADPNRLVRVMTAGEQGTLTIKRVDPSSDRLSLDYDIPVGEADLLLDSLCLRPLLEKTRYREVHDGHIWLIEQFAGENEGLTLAEIEVSSSEAPVPQPAWIGEEVTDDPRYFSSNLWRHPYLGWTVNRRSPPAYRHPAGATLAAPQAR